MGFSKLFYRKVHSAYKLRDIVEDMLWIVVTAFWVPDTFHFFYRSFLRDPDPLTGLVESDKKSFGISASLWLWPHSSRSFSPVSPSCHGLCAYHHDGLWLLLGSGWGVAEKVPWWVVKSPEILWATSSESKPVLLGIHRKNAQSFWMTHVNRGGDWCSMYLGNCLLCGHLVLCSRNEPKKQSKTFAFGTGTSRRRDKQRSGVKTSLWHFAGQWTVRVVILIWMNTQMTGLRCMLYHAVWCRRRFIPVLTIHSMCCPGSEYFSFLSCAFGRLHHTYTSTMTMTHLYLLM